MRYVVGFLFDTRMKKVVLITKEKPKWQKGLLNGVGGKIESDDMFDNTAMAREFEEETGVLVYADKWVNYCNMVGVNNDGTNFSLSVFYVRQPMSVIHKIYSRTEETVHIYDVEKILTGKKRMIGNLKWLIAMAVDHGKGCHPFLEASVIY